MSTSICVSVLSQIYIMTYIPTQIQFHMLYVSVYVFLCVICVICVICVTDKNWIIFALSTIDLFMINNRKLLKSLQYKIKNHENDAYGSFPIVFNYIQE